MRRLLTILILLLSFFYAYAGSNQAEADTTKIYQGMSIKLDIANPIIEAATTKGKNLDFELAMNWRVKNRFYPTFELGYAQADRSVLHSIANAEYTSRHVGQGGFMRVGIDINGLKKHPERLEALLVGIRVGSSFQQYELQGMPLNDAYVPNATIDYPSRFRADCWGEVVFGCQVHIIDGFIMGWALRLKLLFTKTDSKGGPLPYYMPGYGYRDGTNWGVNYYIGWRF